VHPLWFYKHQHDNRVRSKLFVACQQWWFQWRFWFVPSVPGYLREEEYKPDPWCNPIERNHVGLHLENKVAVVKTRQSFRITLYYSDDQMEGNEMGGVCGTYRREDNTVFFLICHPLMLLQLNDSKTFQSNTNHFYSENYSVVIKSRYVFRPVRPSLGEAVTKIYKRRQD